MKRKIFECVPISVTEKLVEDRGLQITFETNAEGRRVLVFDPSAAGRKVLMALVDDDHLSSPLTMQPYEANSKREWTKSSNRVV
jgi:hypothetical protein